MSTDPEIVRKNPQVHAQVIDNLAQRCVKAEEERDFYRDAFIAMSEAYTKAVRSKAK